MEQTMMRTYGDYRVLEEYLQKIGTRRLFLVCGSSIQKLRVDGCFDALNKRIPVIRFSGFTPNPKYEDAVRAVEAFRRSNCDAIIAVGGGSAMDIAKCVKLWAALRAEDGFLNQTPYPNDFPLLAVPTTAGTGSEATRYGVIYYHGEKQSLSCEECIPSAVLLDPSLLESLPDYHRKASMLDALCHGIESFWSVHATKKSREFSRRAICGILENLELYLQNHPKGNAGMLEAAYLAGKAIDLTQTTAGHAMCYKLTTLYGMAHGHAAALCVSKLWPYLAARSRGAELEDTLSELSAAMGCGTIPESIGKFERLLSSLHLETPIPRPEDFLILQNSVNPARLQNTPIVPGMEDILALYRQILSKGGAAECRQRHLRKF